jgi:GNAT superfamily N-acetyltransferase
MVTTLRPGRPADAPVCGEICYRAFATIAQQHNFPPDLPSPEVGVGLMSGLLSRPDVYSVVAEADGRVVGSNFLWESTRIAAIGPITVDPDGQNNAVGRALMLDVMARATRGGFAGTRLVQSAYHNRSLALYTKLGFDAREPLSTIQGPRIGTTLPGLPVRQAIGSDVPACDALCLAVHGHDRSAELQDAIAQGTATVVERHGRITGYATLVGFFGHSVAEANDDLEALIAAAPAFAGPGFLLPTRNAEVLRWCLARGLRIVQPMTLMSIGLYNEPRGAFMPSVLY